MESLIKWKVTVIALLGAISTVIFLFPLAHFEATEILDLKLYYTSSEANNLIGSYSESDRTTYRWFTVTIDVLFPIFYGLFYFTLLALLGRKVYNFKIFEKIKYIALGGAIFDILENFMIFIMLSNYPKPSGIIGNMAGLFTSLKWIYTGITWILIITILISLIIKYIKTLVSGKNCNRKATFQEFTLYDD